MGQFVQRCQLLQMTILAFHAFPVSGVYMPIEDTETAYPVIRHTTDSTPFEWSSGIVAQLRATSKAMRVSNRGVRFIPLSLRMDPITHWDKSDCAYQLDSLCHTTAGTVFFPETDVTIPNTDVADTFITDIAAQECKRFAGRTLSTNTEYDVSLCDITQKGFDFVIQNSTVYAKDIDDHVLFYVTISIATIVLVTTLAQNVAYILQSDILQSDGTEHEANFKLETAMALVVLIITPIQTPYVTTSDYTYYWFTFTYVLLQILLWVLVRGIPTDIEKTTPRAPVNLLVGALLLAMCRLYRGIESEYVGPVLFVLLVRALHKTMTIGPMENEKDALMRASNILDFILIAFTHQYGFRALFAHQTQGDYVFGVIFMIAHTLASYAAHNKKHASM